MTGRRAFLKHAGIVAAAGAALPGCDLLLWPDPRSVAEAMAALLNRPKLARETGRRYLDAVDDLHDASAEAISEKLLGRLGMGTDGLMFVDIDELRDRLDRRIREDFAAERTAVVDGWVLARTECLLCAVAYRLSEGAA